MSQAILSLENNEFLVVNSVQSRPTTQSKLIYYFLIYYISLPFIEAPLRYYLVEYDIPWTIYLRDIFVVLMVSWFIFKSFFFSNDSKIFLILIGLLVLHSVIGLIYLPNPYMVLFG
jgi:hypothetical protein